MQSNARTLYTQLETERYTYLERARDCARLTIPTLFPDESANSVSKYPTPYQGVGARGVNNLASALLLSLLPPNAPFFRLVLDEQAIKQIEGSPDIKTEVEQSLSSIERAVMREIETNSIRVAVFEALKHLIVTGNVLLFLPPEGNMRVFHLDRFVIQRDPMGNPKKIITKETVSPSMLPDEVIGLINQQDQSINKSVDLFTCVHYLPNNKVEVYQEIEGQEVPNSRAQLYCSTNE